MKDHWRRNNWRGLWLAAVLILAGCTATRPANPPVQPAAYQLTFDSTETLPTGVNQVQAQVRLVQSPGSAVLTGSAPLKILKDDSDVKSGLGCDSNMFTQIPGDFTVVSAALTNAGGKLSVTRLVYSLNPTIKCQDDNSLGVNTWSQAWFTGPGNHFAICPDTLDNAGPRPLVTVKSWAFTGSAATAECKSDHELTTIKIAVSD